MCEINYISCGKNSYWAEKTSICRGSLQHLFCFELLHRTALNLLLSIEPAANGSVRVVCSVRLDATEERRYHRSRSVLKMRQKPPLKASCFARKRYKSAYSKKQRSKILGP